MYSESPPAEGILSMKPAFAAASRCAPQEQHAGARRAWLQRLGVRGRLWLLTLSSTCLMLLVGGVGLYGVVRAEMAMRQQFEGRSQALQRIALASELMAQTRYTLSDAVLDPAAPKTVAVSAEAARRIARIDALLRDYQARLGMTGAASRETVPARQLLGNWQRLRDAGFRPAIARLRQNNLSEAQWVMTQAVEPLAQTLAVRANALRDLQVELAQREYRDMRDLTRWIEALVGVGVLIGALLSAVLCLDMARRLYAQLGGEPAGAARMAVAVSNGDLSGAALPTPGKRDSVIGAMEWMRTRLAAMLGDIKHGTETIAAGTDSLVQGSARLREQTARSAVDLGQTAARMSEMAEMVEDNARLAREARLLAAEASTRAAHGHGAVDAAVGDMRDLSGKSERIEAITAAIDRIAFQTNLLALNAAVEAARAGEAGRGFAVVAHEVRALAAGTASASKEIAGLVREVITRIVTARDTVVRAGSALGEMRGAVDDVAARLETIAQASNVQSQGIGEVRNAVAGLDAATRETAAFERQADAAAGVLRDEVERLRAAVSVFVLLR